jgi:predicted signal transduction protein with EAL and GGDEF domain
MGSTGTQDDQPPAPARTRPPIFLVSSQIVLALVIAVTTGLLVIHLRERALILVEWRKQATYLVGSAVILELVVACIGMLMLRQLHGQRMLNEARAARTEAEAARLRTENELVVARERERTDREPGIQNGRFLAALSNMSQSLCLFDSSDRLIVANGRHAEMFGMPTSRITPGATVETLLRRADGESNLSRADVEATLSGIRQLRAAGKRVGLVRELTDGRMLAINFVPFEDGGWLVTFEDITDRRVAATTITHITHHDALTGLPNRVLFHARLSEAVARSRRGESCAVLYLDLDHFKAVNDTLGHPIGDLLLREVTLRLQTQIRETDTVARLGGDEFAIVQSSVNQPDDATALAVRLVNVLGAPYELGGPAGGGRHEHRCRAGSDRWRGPGPDPEACRYGALSCQGGWVRAVPFLHAGDGRTAPGTTGTGDRPRKALAASEFELFYQPLVNLKTGLVTGFEALMRWFHPHRGMVAPADFIPVAEEIGQLVSLGEWALRRACFDAVGWPGEMKVAVNVSVTQFASPSLVEDVAGALAASGLEPRRLELEITETVMLDETDATMVVLHRLRDLGVGIAMDDFGTGYSSLSYLRRFPFSKVKIEQSFVAGLGKGGDCDAIVASVTELCATLGMIALAEGVETEDQLRRLRSGNCDEAQGYLFSRPRPADEVAALCDMPPQPNLAAIAV